MSLTDKNITQIAQEVGHIYDSDSNSRRQKQTKHKQNKNNKKKKRMNQEQLPVKLQILKHLYY